MTAISFQNVHTIRLNLIDPMRTDVVLLEHETTRLASNAGEDAVEVIMRARAVQRVGDLAPELTTFAWGNGSAPEHMHDVRDEVRARLEGDHTIIEGSRSLKVEAGASVTMKVDKQEPAPGDASERIVFFEKTAVAEVIVVAPDDLSVAVRGDGASAPLQRQTDAETLSGSSLRSRRAPRSPSAGAQRDGSNAIDVAGAHRARHPAPAPRVVPECPHAPRGRAVRLPVRGERPR